MEIIVYISLYWLKYHCVLLTVGQKYSRVKGNCVSPGARLATSGSLSKTENISKIRCFLLTPLLILLKSPPTSLTINNSNNNNHTNSEFHTHVYFPILQIQKTVY